MKKRLLVGMMTFFLMVGMAGMVNAAIVEGFEESDTIFTFYSSSPRYDLDNTESSHTGNYSFKVNPSNCGVGCYGYYVNLTHTFNTPTMVEGIGLWAMEGSTYGSAWGGKIRVGHDAEWDLNWWGVVNNGDSITGDWQYIYVPINEISSTITINVFDITSDSSVWLDDIEIGASSVPIPGAIWLLGSGIFGLAGFRQKRKK
jgi:hypothetical protein